MPSDDAQLRDAVLKLAEAQSLFIDALRAVTVMDDVTNDALDTAQTLISRAKAQAAAVDRGSLGRKTP